MIKKLFLVAWSFTCCSVMAQNTADSLAYTPSVLIEMFSSEGCSSCPLADQFMQKIINIADSNDQPVYVLDYHVNIWDNSTWKDKHADTSWTSRQKIYMDKTGQPALFTPMLIVNGRFNLSAGEKKDVGKAITTILSGPMEASLNLNAQLLNEKNAVDIQYRIFGKTDSTQLVFVLAEREVESKVTGGENAGQTLVHHHVVRKLLKTDVKAATDRYQFPVEKGVDLSKYILTVFVQHRRTWQVYASGQIVFK